MAWTRFSGVTANLTGKTAIVTGASTGIGRVTAVELAKHGAFVILAGRSPDKHKAVLDEIAAVTQRTDAAELWTLELSSLASVRAFAQRFIDSGKPLHLLINNAGLASPEAEITADGFEPHFQINYLSHFLLTELLLPSLKASAPSRIVNVSSNGSFGSTGIHWDKHRNYKAKSIREAFGFYCDSKFLQIAHTMKLASELKGTGVTVFALHPGAVASEIWRGLWAPLAAFLRLFMYSVEDGAMPTLMCATADEVLEHSGSYYDRLKVKDPNPLLRNNELVEELWTRSKEMVAQN